MPFIEWIDALSVGVEEIDAQHKVLIGKINDLASARDDKRGRVATMSVLLALEDYVYQHFGLEERYFREFEYADATAHIAEHDNFRRKLEEFHTAFLNDESALSEDILAFLKSWLTKHISFTDRKYRTLFLSKGLH